MRNVMRLTTWIGSLVLSTTVMAADAPNSAMTKKGADVSASKAHELKLGVLDSQKLMSSAPQAKEAGKRLEKEFQEPNNELVNKQKEFQVKRDKLQRDREVISNSERSKREKELVRMEQDLRRMDEELRSDFATRHREEMDEFSKTVRSVVESLAKEEHYDLILPQEVMVYFGEQIDVTDKVLARLEKQKAKK